MRLATTNTWREKNCEKKRELIQELLQLAAEISELQDRKSSADDFCHENTAAVLDQWIKRRIERHDSVLAALLAHQKSHGC